MVILARTAHALPVSIKYIAWNDQKKNLIPAISINRFIFQIHYSA